MGRKLRERDRSARGTCDPVAPLVSYGRAALPSEEEAARVAEPVECPAIGLTAVVVLVEGTGHRLRPVEEWPPAPIARCGVVFGESPTLVPGWQCVVDDVPLCARCWLPGRQAER